MALKDDTYFAHWLVPGESGQVARRSAGRFLVHNGYLHHLEDYHRKLEDHLPEGLVDDLITHRVKNPGPDLSVAARGDVRAGRRLDFVPEHPLAHPLPPPTEVASPPKEVKPPSVFHYLRAGHDAPHVLEARAGGFALDGNPLDHREVAHVLDTVRSGAAKLRYPKAPREIVKAEAALQGLCKAMDVEDALAHLDQLDTGDARTPEAVKAVRQLLFEDPMTGLGNKLAYTKFRQKHERGGVSVLGDANHFKRINDELGHEAGDDAIRALGTAWKGAAEETGEGKAHRFGGDEFHAHFPTLEHAARFARNLRGKLEATPAMGGTHPLSMSLGFGQDPVQADKALYAAKGQKAQHAKLPAVLAHSLHPEAPGPVPTSVEELPYVPPAPEPSVPAAEPKPVQPAA